MAVERFTLETPRGPVSAAWHLPPGPRAIALVAHGAGVNMDHPLMVGFAEGLEVSGMAALRFNFRYMEEGRKAPDGEASLREVYRAANDWTQERFPGKLHFACGKSLGGRIASMLVADGMPTDGLVFIGYPLHAPGKPEKLRADHLERIRVRMLFLWGTKDPFARESALRPLIERLRPWARLHAVTGGDHSCVVRGVPEDETGRLLGGRAARFIQAAER
ncbi:MAG TPA: alpha/beta family hydrolase [Actinomycetota bacterium]|nr:alpha/beta family hydrolase [Actinomycetota bacterium]